MSKTPDWAEETESKVLDEALRLAPGMGWSREMTRAAARTYGLSSADAELLLPQGPRDLAALLSRRHDAKALESLPEADGLKIRERIRIGCTARLDAALADTPAVRRWAAFLALPTNAALAMSLVWESADHIWRWAGDTATDENHYSKRAILSGVLMSVLTVGLTQGRSAALETLDARIENVMAFEKWKAGIKTKPSDLARTFVARAKRVG